MTAKESSRRNRVDPRVQHMRTLNSRVDALIKAGLNLRQVSKIIGASYSGLHRARSADLNFSERTLKAYHESLSTWCKQIGLV